MDEKPWKWDDLGKVRFALDGGEVRDFKLIATDPKKVIEFQRELSLAQEVTITLYDAKQAFVDGRADYENAATKLKGILSEWGVASARQHDVAAGVARFFMPDGLAAGFGNDTNALTDFADETIKRLLKAAVKAKTPPAPPAPPEPPGEPTEPGPDARVATLVEVAEG